jgi:hypothetical protein
MVRAPNLRRRRDAPLAAKDHIKSDRWTFPTDVTQRWPTKIDWRVRVYAGPNAPIESGSASAWIGR